MNTPSRQSFLKSAATDVGFLPLATLANTTGPAAAFRPLKFVCVGKYPDDLESGCDGILLRLRKSAVTGEGVERRESNIFDGGGEKVLVKAQGRWGESYGQYCLYPLQESL